MKIAFFLSVMLFLSQACSTDNRPSHANWADSTFQVDSSQQAAELEAATHCYLSVGGGNQRDTSYVKLEFDSDSIHGIFNWIPYEKDSRKGTIAGIKKADTLDVIWTFQQEGMMDTLRTFFYLANDRLRQRSFVADPASGRQVSRTSGRFDVNYQKIDCP